MSEQDFQRLKALSKKRPEPYPCEKNRYYNILPFDENTVQLSTKEYINASHIQTSICPHRKYIATQAPIPETFCDFYQMIWDYDIRTVLMLTETKKGKSDCYWPQFEERVDMNGITVQLVSEDCFHGLIIRKLRLDHRTTTRSITHIQFVEWPDHSIPKVEPFLRLLEITKDETHFVVHCSAGVGRTGVFCAMDSLRHCQGKLFDIVREFRQQRMMMVETLEQYQFCETVLQLLNKP